MPPRVRGRGYIMRLPNEVLERIFFLIDHLELYFSCVDVDDAWAKVLTDTDFWLRYHKYWGQIIPEGVAKLGWKTLAHIPAPRKCFEVNILKNNSGQIACSGASEGLDPLGRCKGVPFPIPDYPGWTICTHAGEGWRIFPMDASSIVEDPGNLELLSMEPSFYFRSSFRSCEKYQEIDLVKYGISPRLLNDPELEFEVEFSEFFFLSGPSSYEVSLLIKKDDGTDIQLIAITEHYSAWKKEFDKGLWGRARRVVQINGIQRMRTIEFRHKGTSDGYVPNGREEEGEGSRAQGVKMTEAYVKVHLPSLCTRSKSQRLKTFKLLIFPTFEVGKVMEVTSKFQPEATVYLPTEFYNMQIEDSDSS